ncbi:MAG: DUF2812 domain-containing protein [Ruminococcus sp.]|nr:DUF2812 domain-containing protein [Ruminococcus sp.]
MSEKHEYRKRFYDLEKEESWLNQMCAGGLVLKKIEWGVLADKYVFEPCAKKYVCRIDYNPEMEVLDEITSPYTMFVTGTYEAEFVCCANGKIYFRKAAEKGDFPPIYTSPDSRISAEKKWFLKYLILTLTCIFTEIYFGYGYYGVMMLRKGITIAGICFLLAAIFNMYLIVHCAVRAFNHYKKIKELKKL